MKYIVNILLITFTIVVLTACESKTQNQKQTQDSKADAYLDTIQLQTINYFWKEADKTLSGLAPERVHMDNIYPQNDANVITTGGSGFGLMALIAGIDRGFIEKEAGLKRFERIVSFLEKADRFHGAWPHWMDGNTGKVVPFSKNDDGGDLVETSFLMQGLLTVQAYYKKHDSARAQDLVSRIQTLWEEVEWSWYTQGKEVLYWHWSPTNGWKMNFAVGGYNECLIMYVLAASSPTYPISAEVYHKGWARNGTLSSDAELYGIPTVVDYYQHNDAKIGPLFWSHYSYLGLNPFKLSDRYADYGQLTTNHAKIHLAYAIDNPKNFKGYGEDMWGLTSSYSMKGYAGHRPGNDLGVIAPTAALSSMPYLPMNSQKMLVNLYENHKDLIGAYGPYDAFSLQEDWMLPRYLAIDQGPIPVMIENYRSGLLWELFMSNTEVQQGLRRLGFTIKEK